MGKTYTQKIKDRITHLGKGTYVLIIKMEIVQPLIVGKLGKFNFRNGFYAYVGSALGPGGLHGRLKHHLFSDATPRWHVDYLTSIAPIAEIWFTESNQKLEHSWANLLSDFSSLSVQIHDFGSSDCACNTHLFYFSGHPELDEFSQLMNHASVHDYSVCKIVM